MKNRKRHGCHNPVLIRSRFVDNNYKDCSNQEGKQEAPAFPHLDQHFVQVILNINSTNYKRNYQQAHGCYNPYRSWKSRESETNMGNQVLPIQLADKIQCQNKKIIRRSKSNKTYEPFLNSKWAHNQQGKKQQQQKCDSRNIKQGCKTQKKPDIEYRTYRIRTII